MTHPYVIHPYMRQERHDSSICDSSIWLIHMCDMTHPYVIHPYMRRERHDSSIYTTLPIQKWITYGWVMSIMSYIWMSHVFLVFSFICVTWLIHMYDMTHSKVRPGGQGSGAARHCCLFSHVNICISIHTHTYYEWSGEGLQHLLGATKRAFSVR